MSGYEPVPFPFDDPSDPDIAVETPLWKGGPRPQWEVAGEPDPNAVGKATNDFLLNGKPLSLAASRQTLDDDHYTYAQIGADLWRSRPYPVGTPISLDPRHPIPVLWRPDLIDAVRQTYWLQGSWEPVRQTWGQRFRSWLADQIGWVADTLVENAQPLYDLGQRVRNKR